MSDLFIRDWRVRVQRVGTALGADGQVVAADIHAPVRIQFSISKTLQVAPNTLDLRITNASPENRRQMKEQSALVVLEAGHVGSTAIVFQGIARTIDQLRDGPDWVSHIQCGDGELTYRFAQANYSFGAGTTVATIAQALAQQLTNYDGTVDVSVFLRQLPTMDGAQRTFQHGDAYSGNALTRLQQLFPKYQLSIQTGELRALRIPDAKAVAGVSLAAVVVLAPGTGLIGSPEHGSPDRSGRDSIIKARSLLQPKIQPGDRVQLESAQFTGTYRAEKVTHTGDSAGQPWYTDLELRSAQWQA